MSDQDLEALLAAASKGPWSAHAHTTADHSDWVIEPGDGEPYERSVGMTFQPNAATLAGHENRAAANARFAALAPARAQEVRDRRRDGAEVLECLMWSIERKDDDGQFCWCAPGELHDGDRQPEHTGYCVKFRKALVTWNAAMR